MYPIICGIIKQSFNQKDYYKNSLLTNILEYYNIFENKYKETA